MPSPQKSRKRVAAWSVAPEKEKKKWTQQDYLSEWGMTKSEWDLLNAQVILFLAVLT